MRFYQHSGQSLLEYIVLIALVTIVAVSLVAGIGQRSTSRFHDGTGEISEASIASATDRQASAM